MAPPSSLCSESTWRRIPRDGPKASILRRSRVIEGVFSIVFGCPPGASFYSDWTRCVYWVLSFTFRDVGRSLGPTFGYISLLTSVLVSTPWSFFGRRAEVLFLFSPSFPCFCVFSLLFPLPLFPTFDCVSPVPFAPVKRVQSPPRFDSCCETSILPPAFFHLRFCPKAAPCFVRLFLSSSTSLRTFLIDFVFNPDLFFNMAF